jgi:hypothetical protein
MAACKAANNPDGIVANVYGTDYGGHKLYDH